MVVHFEELISCVLYVDVNVATHVYCNRTQRHCGLWKVLVSVI